MANYLSTELVKKCQSCQKDQTHSVVYNFDKTNNLSLFFIYRKTKNIESNNLCITKKDIHSGHKQTNAKENCFEAQNS